MTLPDTSVFSVPRLSARQEKLVRFIAVVALGYHAYWIWWRWTSTLNPEIMWYSVSLVLAETYSFWMALVLLITVWKLKVRNVPVPPAGLSVDVFITNYDEPLEVLRRTAIGAKQIAYPHNTYMLDDGKRDDVKRMAEELKIGYIRREGNEHAKAGNLNNAFKHTKGEFILQLDADHVPLPHILHRLLGYFQDEKVAFVQSPQDFYNTDSFTHVVNDEGRRMWEENRIFFSLIQAGKDTFNASFFCGSCGVLRRSAFESIGGFSTRTVTEDMETSLVLHMNGWNSVYHGETLAYGLAPASAVAYHVQRLRWGQGSMQMLRMFNPLFAKGLTLGQRFQYFTATTTYLDGYHKLIFYVAPMIFFFTGALPVLTTDRELLSRLIPYMFLNLLAFEMLSRGTGWTFISERYSMVKFWTYIVATTGFFRKNLEFHVTPKGAGDVPVKTYLPQLIIMTVSTISVIWAALASYYGWVDYRNTGWGSLAFVLNGFWLGYNFYFAAFIVRHSLRSKQKRTDHRFVDTFPVEVSLLSDNGTIASTRHAITQNLNTSGMAFRAPYKIEEGGCVIIPLEFNGGVYKVSGIVLHVSESPGEYGTTYTHGVQFGDLPVTTRDAIELHCTQHSVPLWRAKYRQSIPLIERSMEIFGNIRGQKRKLVELPAYVAVHGDGTSDAEVNGVGVALLEEVSAGGARLLMDNPLPPGTRLSYSVPGTRISGEGRVTFNLALESPLNIRFSVGVERTDAESVTANNRWRFALPWREIQRPTTTA